MMCAVVCVPLQVFFAAVGASADIRLVLATAPILFGWSFVALAGHLLLLLGLGRLAGFSRKELLLASNANIGGARGRQLRGCRTAWHHADAAGGVHVM
jgi:uncharacterized membrane protein